MNLISLDTSTESCSVALSIGGRLTERYELAPRRHAELILPMVDELLREAGVTLRDLDALAFGRGPGAFTGVRIAAGVIQGLAFGAEKPVVAISSLAALAQGVAAGRAPTTLMDTLIMSAIDARMGEVYWGVYRVETDGLVVLVGEEQVAKPEQVALPLGSELALRPLNTAGGIGATAPNPVRLVGVGSGWQTYGAALRARCGNDSAEVFPDRYPHARDVLALAQRDFAAGLAVSAEEAQPVYIRNKVTG